MQTFTYQELRAMAVQPHEPGAYSGSPVGEGDVGLHVHPGTDDVHVYVAGFSKLAEVFPDRTRFLFSRESTPERARGLRDMLPHQDGS